MHHSHVYEDFLPMYILFARRTHEHEGTFPIFTPFTTMHIAKIPVTHSRSVMIMHSHDLMFHIYMIHTCRGSLCMLHVFPKLYLLFSISLFEALMYVAINYQKGGD